MKTFLILAVALIPFLAASPASAEDLKAYCTIKPATVGVGDRPLLTTPSVTVPCP